MDEDGFERVHAQTAEPLRKYVIHVVGSVSIADDIVQDTYMRFVLRPPDGRHPRQVRAYLFRIATNLIRDHWREHRHDPMAPDPRGASAPTRDYSLRLDMDRALRRLRPRERQLLWLAHVEGVDHRTIAEMTGLKHKSVRVLLFRARQALARSLQDSAQERVTAAMAADIDQFASQILATGIVPGMSLAVVTSEGIACTRGYGFANVESQLAATADTQFYIASTTKALTALAGALLHDRGRLDLDAPLSFYLPDAQMHPELSATDISLRDLLTMTHGIASIGPVDIRAAFTGDASHPELKALLRHHPPAENGRKFRYGNLGYNVFSLVLEDRFPGGWKQVVRDAVLLPLQMDSTTAFVTQADRSRLAMPYRFRESGLERLRYAKHDETMHAAGGHISTVKDMARFVATQLGAGRLEGVQVFPSSVIEETRRQHAAQDRRLGPYERCGWGLGWDLARYAGDAVVQRFGGFSGFSSHVSFMPDHDLGVVVLANATGPAGQLGDMVARFAYHRVLGKPDVDARFGEELRGAMEMITSYLSRDAAARNARPQTTPLPLAAYAGEYASPVLGRLRWTWEDDRLLVRWGVAESTVEVYDGAQHQLRVGLLGGGAVVDFDVPTGATRPIGFEFLNRTFIRTAVPD